MGSHKMKWRLNLTHVKCDGRRKEDKAQYIRDDLQETNKKEEDYRNNKCFSYFTSSKTAGKGFG